MNHLKLLSFTLIFFISFAHAEPIQKLAFAEENFTHAFSSTEGNVVMDEYVTTGSTLENWKHLLAHRVYPKSNSVIEVVKQYNSQIRPTRQPAVYANKDYTDVMLMFLAEPADKSYLEFNIHRFVTQAGEIHSYQFAAKASSENITELMNDLAQNKPSWVKAIYELSPKSFEQ